MPADLKDLGTIASEDAVSYIRTTADGRPAVLVNIVRQPDANTVAIARGVDALFRQTAGPDSPRRPLDDLLRSGRLRDAFGQRRARRHPDRRRPRGARAAGCSCETCGSRSSRSRRFPSASPSLLLAARSVTGQTINLMTLGGIAAALGLIADDAIVVVENIHRHREAGAPRIPRGSGLLELMPALVGSTLSTSSSFCRFALLTGVTGAFFKPLALTMALALVVSFLPGGLRRSLAGIGALGADPRAPRGNRRSRFQGAVSSLLHPAQRSLAAAVPLLLLAGALPALPSDRDRLPAGDGRRLDHPRLLDAARNVADRHRRDAPRRREDHHVVTGRAGLLPPHRNAARASSSPSPIAATTSSA